MKIHEYQAVELMSSYGVPTCTTKVASTPEEAMMLAKTMETTPYVIKAQVHSGGRGKAGGVKFANTPEEVFDAANSILGMTLVTKQTGPQGRLVRKVVVCESVKIEKEYYVSITVDGSQEREVLIASAAGGMEIEQTAEENPELILTHVIDPEIGLKDYHLREIAVKLGMDASVTKQFVRMGKCLYKLFREKDCSLIEINPLIVNDQGKLIAADAKVNFDDNALPRHADILAMRDVYEEDPREVEASKYDLNYIQLDGNIGCMVNGAGLAMATMDIIQANGGTPANFLDVGGGATEAKVTGAFSILLSDQNVKGLFVNIFGGIMRCDVIAAGIVAAAKKCNVNVPLVVRLDGTNAELGKSILVDSGLAITPAEDMADGAKKICALVKGEEVSA